MILYSVKYHTTLAGYFSAQPLFFDGDLQNKPHIRKCVELPFQQTKAQLWDEVTDTLCNLDFIQAKTCAKMTYDLIRDYNDVLKVIPDNAENIKQEKERQARMEKYTMDLIDCAKGELSIDELDIPESITPWPQEKIDAEIGRIKTNPTKLSRLKDFTNFLGQEAGNFQNYAFEFPYFSTQQAWNYAAEGPVGKAAEKSPLEVFKSLLCRTSATRPPWNPLPQALKMLKGHTDSVMAVSISLEGQRAFSGSQDNTCILWDLGTGKRLQTLSGHNGWVNAVSITPDGQRAISGSYDQTCILWDLRTGFVLRTLRGHTFPVEAISITPDGQKAISGSSDNTCIFWDLCTGQTLQTLRGHNGYVSAVSITPNGKLAISGSTDQTCILWNLETGQSLQFLRGHTSWVTAISIFPDGQRAISGSYDMTCILWDLRTGGSLQILRGHTSKVNAVAITGDGQKAISCSDDKICIFWDLRTGQALKILRGHNSEVKAISITPDGRMAISGADDNTCVLWDLEKGQALQTIGGHSQTVEAISITPDGQRAISGADDNTCILWDLETGQALQTLRGHKDRVTALSISPDGQRAISGSDDKTCILWDLGTGQALKTFREHPSWLNAFYITADGQRAISNSWDNTCIIWNLRTGKELQTLRGHTGFVSNVSITPDGQRIISCGDDNTCILWDLNKGEALKTLKGHTKEVNTVSITPDGQRVISGSGDNTCILWDLKSGQALQTLEGHADSVFSVAISHDGQRTISGSYNNNCILWNLNTGKKLACFTTASSIRALKIYPNGILLGLRSGEMVILNANKKLLCPGIAITTVLQLWDFEMQKYPELSSDCPMCGHRFAPPASVLTTIERITKKASLIPEQSPCLELPKEAWEESGLLCNCPKCGEKLKYNPFIAGKYISVMDEIKLKYSKIYEKAESAYNKRKWEKAENLYLKLIHLGMFDATELRFKMAFCIINGMTDYNPERIRQIQVLLIDILKEQKRKKKNDKIEIILKKLENLIKEKELSQQKQAKPLWKKLFLKQVR
jgi:WD40 repeat protein